VGRHDVSERRDAFFVDAPPKGAENAKGRSTLAPGH
jgi:hypothetical protein